MAGWVHVFRGVFRNQANIYDEALVKKSFFTENSIIDSRIGFKEASENNEIFKMKPSWSKSL